MRESSGGTWDLGVEDSFGEFLDIVNFLFLGDEEAEIGVGFFESLELWHDGGDIEFILQFSCAIFEGFVM